MRLAPAVCAAAALLAPACGEPREPGHRAPAARPLAHDPRLGYLLAPCALGGHYDVNTADVEAILTESLLHGQRDTLRRARAELAAREGGLEIARRVMRRFWMEPDGKNHIRNALDVAALADDPAARSMLVEALGHPMEDLRVVAVKALKKHGTAEDWGAVRDALDQSSGPFVLDHVQTMHRLDPARTQRLILDWVEGGLGEPIWPDVLPLLAGATDPAVLERCRALWPRLPKGQAAPLLAALAAAGDEEALRRARAFRDDEANPTLRRIALLALGRAGLLDELVPSLCGDVSPENRVLALGVLTETPERTERMRAHLAAGMSDPVDAVAAGCTAALARIGDPAAIERGLQLLRDDTPGAVQSGLRILHEAMARDPAVARRALEVAIARYEASAHRPMEERALFLVAMGQVPLADAAERLLAEAGSVAGEIQSQSAGRWVTMQAGNVGPAAHPLLVARLAEEEDPARRLDLLEALAVRGGDEARERLLAFVEAYEEGGRTTPYEVLYAADRLVRIGPAAVVAPVLKRVTLRVQKDDVRRALQCLLWAAYPGPRP